MTETNAYRMQSVTTAGPAQLVLMLYDGVLAAIERARRAATDAAAPGTVETINRELQRAQNIVSELQVTLDHEQGGGIAANLHALYDFCLDRLVRANVTKELDELDAVWRVLASLREAWAESCCTVPVTAAAVS